MKKSIIFLFLCTMVLQLSAQKPESVLFSIGGDHIMVSDFQYIYEKNNKNDQNYYSEESIRDYLNLFVNFKLKVKEAKSMGIDTTGKFVDEFKMYREQLTKPYLTDKKTTDKLVLEAYERMKEEIRASHILIRVDEDASQEDVEKALNKINEVYKRAKKGEDFAKLALEYSEDPSAKTNQGDLDYFSVFHLIYSFEDVAYKTPVGKISKPFRTEFGYHILKITDRRPYKGTIKIAQLFIPFSTDNADAAQEKERVKAKIDEIYQNIQKGESFEKMVKLYSEDERTKSNDGIVPEFNTFSGNVHPRIKEEAFKLEKDGAISTPFETNTGWYIIKRIELKPLKPYEEMENYIRNKVKKDSRSQQSYTSLIADLKKQYHFKEYPKALQSFNSLVDTSVLKGQWFIKDKNLMTETLFLIGKEKYTQLDFAEFIVKRQKSMHFNHLNYAVAKYYEGFVNESLMNYADQHLEENYPEFRSLVNEYREGMLLFEITDMMVWSKAMKDTSGQEKFYSDNQKNYMWKKRVDAETYICRNEEIAAKVKDMLVKENKSADDIAKLLNEENPLNVSYSKGRYEEGENKLLEEYFHQKGVFVFVDASNNWRVVHLINYIDAEPKKLSEIRGIVIADYQNYLEQQWIKELKLKYPVIINEKILAELISNHKK